MLITSGTVFIRDGLARTDLEIKIQVHIMTSHTFDIQVASVVGINAAVICSNIQFWCDYNKANNKNCHEDKYWVYNSVKSWGLLFPYMTPKQIRTALDKLIANGFIFKGEFNKANYDKTSWYAFNYKGQAHLPSEANRIAPEGEPIPVVNTVSKPLKDICDLKSPRIKIVEQVIDYYHEILTTMPKIKKVTKTRIASVNARHKEDLNNNIENWPDYFNYIKDNCTWMLDPKYGINFDYLINQTNYVKILEGTKNDR